MRLVVCLLSVVALAFAGPAVADAPAEYTFGDVFTDVNPCTGKPMMVTLVAKGFSHQHGSREVVHAERTITTSDGFAGRGTEQLVINGRVAMFRFSDIMRHPSGGLFRARGVFVLNLSKDTVRVDRFELTCLSK